MAAKDDLDTRFTAHLLDGAQQERCQEIRARAGDLAHLIVDTTPESREQSRALTKLEEVVFWASAAIARREH
jgi:hypothetical protein